MKLVIWDGCESWQAVGRVVCNELCVGGLVRLDQSREMMGCELREIERENESLAGGRVAD